MPASSHETTFSRWRSICAAPEAVLSALSSHLPGAFGPPDVFCHDNLVDVCKSPITFKIDRPMFHVALLSFKSHMQLRHIDHSFDHTFGGTRHVFILVLLCQHFNQLTSLSWHSHSICTPRYLDNLQFTLMLQRNAIFARDTLLQICV